MYQEHITRYSRVFIRASLNVWSHVCIYKTVLTLNWKCLKMCFRTRGKIQCKSKKSHRSIHFCCGAVSHTQCCVILLAGFVTLQAFPLFEYSLYSTIPQCGALRTYIEHWSRFATAYIIQARAYDRSIIASGY
jgi:hypothetical protein